MGKEGGIGVLQGYEPFGSLLPGRNYSSDSYRFGFNGKENDNEVHGAVGTFQDYGMRAYDTRVGRFFSVDPMARQFPFYTPYQFAGNKPTIAKDLDGLEEWIVVKYPFGDGTGRMSVSVSYVEEQFRRVGANGERVMGVDYYLSSRTPNGNPDFNTDNFLNPTERRLSTKPTSYYTNSGRNQGTQAYPLSQQHTLGTPGRSRATGTARTAMGQYRSYAQNAGDRQGSLIVGIGGVQPMREFSAYFETNITDRSMFAADVNMNVAAMAQAMITDPTLNLTITGYASKDGTDAYNQGLSQQRANFITGAIQQAITASGSSMDISGRVNVVFMGESQASGGEEADVPTDRRVDVRLQ
ncbi:MAG: OmpA family protein [Flavobacteriales bacterium]|nr:OmpA family protein [Flavobacteriales bacterium]